ncbi:MAG TPA: geranylgeranyl reductase family protein [Candidatus Diapherotrites archaeon]|uniref:Geranylgeranyl reductase family protein n=1 Tax=Candidatus Iainarchaeum sp. TaxID=3101447 RepID=A0A7J4IWK4_9ARCH|nr:geranylgeranyl reductase family protein [Candidatus Diapherotrites archaeon]
MAAIVGAGPAGLAAAKRLQERGWKSVILEEHAVVGDPVACTGLISSSGVNELGIRKEVEETLLNKLRGAQIFSHNHEMIEVKRTETVAYVIDRGAFDRALAREAIAAGAELRLETGMIDVRKETVFVEHKGRGEIIKAKVIVGADGANSKTRRIMGINTGIENFVHAYQVDVKGHFDPHFAQVFLGNYAKGFFAWIVPENEERARVGLASTSGNVRKDFNVFINEKNITGEACDMCSKLIPVGEPLKATVKDNMLLAGDAAFQTKASTGGGIILGMHAGRICADAIHDHFASDAPLKNYEKGCNALNNDLRLHWKIRQFINSKSEEQIDKLFREMGKAKVGEFLSEHGDMDRPSRFIGKALTKPSMWRLLPQGLKFLST